MTGSTNVRAWGLLLVVLVLLAAVVIPNARTRTVAGTAQAVPVPSPPTVGDCVTNPIDPGWETAGIRSATGGTTVGTYTYPQVGISHCRVGHYGEITALIADPAKPVVTTTSTPSGSSMNVNDPNMDNCRTAGYRYVGIAMTGGLPERLPGGWYPMLVIGVAASTPSIRQQAAGQHWLGCVVYLQPSGDFASATGRERYDTSLRNSFFTGMERNSTGVCVSTADLNEAEIGQVGCAADHRSEIFGTSSTGNQSENRSDLERSCRQLVTHLTNIATLTAAGLTVEMLATDANQAVVTASSIPAGTDIACGVGSRHRTLAGSVRALGSQPIPWK